MIFNFLAWLDHRFFTPRPIPFSARHPKLKDSYANHYWIGRVINSPILNGRRYWQWQQWPLRACPTSLHSHWLPGDVKKLPVRFYP